MLCIGQFGAVYVTVNNAASPCSWIYIFGFVGSLRSVQSKSTVILFWLSTTCVNWFCMLYVNDKFLLSKRLKRASRSWFIACNLVAVIWSATDRLAHTLPYWYGMVSKKINYPIVIVTFTVNVSFTPIVSLTSICDSKYQVFAVPLPSTITPISWYELPHTSALLQNLSKYATLSILNLSENKPLIVSFHSMVSALVGGVLSSPIAR